MADSTWYFVLDHLHQQAEGVGRLCFAFTDNLNHGWSKAKIIGVAVGAGVGAILLLLTCVVCILRCVNKARNKQAKALRPRKAMTPQHAQPFWETHKKADAASGAINMTASSSALPPTDVQQSVRSSIRFCATVLDLLL